MIITPISSVDQSKSGSKSAEKQTVIPKKVVLRKSVQAPQVPPKKSVIVELPKVIAEAPNSEAGDSVKMEENCDVIPEVKRASVADQTAKVPVAAPLPTESPKDIKMVTGTTDKDKQTKNKKKHPKIQIPLIDRMKLDEDFKDNRTLKESGEYSWFLLKVSFEFLIFYLALSAIVCFILLDIPRSRKTYEALGMNVWTWASVGLLTTIKLLCGFYGRKMRSILKLFWFIDLIASCVFAFGLFYFLQGKTDNSKDAYSPYVIIYILNLFASMCGFVLSTFYHSRTRRYNIYIGWLLMTLATTLTTIALQYGWDTQVQLSREQYIGIAIVMAVHNFYIVMEAYFMVTRRAAILREHESLRAFYSVFTDLTYRFWKDLYGKINHHLMTKKAAKEAASASKEARVSRKSKVTIPLETYS